MTPLAITACTAVSAVGHGRAALLTALREERTGLTRVQFEDAIVGCYLGEVAGVAAHALPTALRQWDCRNNRLIEMAVSCDGFAEEVAAARSRHGASRIGVFMGTSTAGVRQTELAYAARAAAASESLPDWYDFRTTQSSYSVAEYTRERLGLSGVCIAIAAACASSAKAFASAARAIATGVCDAAIVGGADSLCLTTLYGFNALQLISSDICRPADSARNGLSLGEAAGLALLEPANSGSRPLLLGYGESSDAHHMSQPRPDGQGAILAMQLALQRAGLEPRDIDYVNLHGTATPANDLAEDSAVCSLLGTTVPCSSTKGWTGHALGAAGILEAIIATLAIEQGLMPLSLNTRELDPALTAAVLRSSRHGTVRHVMSNSFGFGGANCSLIIGAAR
jgi:3-oxoacyl-[acyl-carrier-protein] synthase-1